MKLTLFQTLEDRSNPDEVESRGPFLGNIRETWLGEGYYFWDGHVELAHWWGTHSYPANGYMICRAGAIMDDSCWDLVGKSEHRIEFEEICNEIIINKISSREKLRVAEVINFLKKKGLFIYKAIRAHSQACMNPDTYPKLAMRVAFSKKNSSFLDVKPPIQVCLLEKRALSLHSYQVIFPEHYQEIFA